MPFFKTTTNILTDYGEYFESKWMDSNELQLPPRQNWDYQREMQIEDVDLWEVVYEMGVVGVYAAWSPYAEFYLIKPPNEYMEQRLLDLETFYGKNAASRCFHRLKSHYNITLPTHQVWVDNDDMWLHTKD